MVPVKIQILPRGCILKVADRSQTRLSLLRIMTHLSNFICIDLPFTFLLSFWVEENTIWFEFTSLFVKTQFPFTFRHYSVVVFTRPRGRQTLSFTISEVSTRSLSNNWNLLTLIFIWKIFPVLNSTMLPDGWNVIKSFKQKGQRGLSTCPLVMCSLNNVWFCVMKSHWLHLNICESFFSTADFICSDLSWGVVLFRPLCL